MASSDDECDTIPQIVSNYHFVDEKDVPVSFSELPIQWNDNDHFEGKEKRIFMHGTTDNGLQKLYKQVVSWKYDLLNAQPEISILLKDFNWIKLQKPRKSFKDIIRTILVTLQCLHFLKRNPDSSGNVLWDHVCKVFSLYEPKPSENDLVHHMALISEAVKRDDTLAKSKFLSAFLEEKPPKRISFDEVSATTSLSGFIVDEDMIDEMEDDGSDEENDLFDHVCAICDNGGELLCCEGRCLRSFHATVDAGADSMCESLGLSDVQVNEIQSFLCKNCKYKQHQCFVCGRLGSSDKASGAEVFQCVSATCGLFYHPPCVANLLYHGSVADAEQLKKKIASGEPFTCPVHKCCVCNQVENKMDHDLQFAVCRRCPKSYHRKCLPSKIAFEDNEDDGIFQRAWEGLIPNRILIYCLKHAIHDDLATPVRDHIRFPDFGDKKKRKVFEVHTSDERAMPKKKGLGTENFVERQIVQPPIKGKDKFSSASKRVDSSKTVRRTLVQDSFRKQKVNAASQKTLKRVAGVKGTKCTSDERKTSLGDKLYAYFGKGSDFVKSSEEDISESEDKSINAARPVTEEIDCPFSLDSESKQRILNLMKDASSNVTLEDVMRTHGMASTHLFSSRTVVDKTITLGKVEGSIEAIRAALQKIEEGCSIEDAKAVCEPGILNQIAKWKGRLKVYLAPFIYGMRYTSYGRHFTKVEKLNEIVNILHWYVQDGDMVVDFCCGANDFSCLMKKKLDETGKDCFYRNFDLLQAKNDFNFVKRDWMSVKPKELPSGSNLIMGLNPPFGVNAGLANKFIDKALEFKPKLLILIVPEEAERLDKKKLPYDLIWEDNLLLAGKAFYLPGSVDVNDKQVEDWNINSPPLYLWSRPDWTTKHKLIAQQHGHLSRGRAKIHLEQNYIEKGPFDCEEKHYEEKQFDRHAFDRVCTLEEENHHEIHASNLRMNKDDLNSGSSMSIDDLLDVEETTKDQDTQGSATRICNDGFSCDDVGTEKHGNPTHNQSTKNSERQTHISADLGVYHSGENLAEDKQNGKRSMFKHSPSTVMASRLSEDYTRRTSQMPSSGHLSVSASNMQWQAEYNGSWEDNVTKSYHVNREEPYPRLTNSVWTSDINPSDYGLRNSEEQYMGYHQGRMDTHGARQSYVREIDQNYQRESDLRSKVRLYGKPCPDSSGQTGYLGGHHPGFSPTYMHLGSTIESLDTRNNTSTLQRYAPRLEELNHTRVRTSLPDIAFQNKSSIYNPSAPDSEYGASSSSFVPGPYRPFSQRNNSGWHNE